MPRFGRPKQRAGYAAAGQYTCKGNWTDRQTKEIVVCGKPVPEGELTHLSLNVRSGSYLALCVECRVDLEEELLPWLAAQVGVGRLLSDLTELPNKELVSHSDLKQVLVDHQKLELKPGPLSPEQQLVAVELRNGREAREWVEKNG